MSKMSEMEATIIIPKTDTVTVQKIKAAIQAAYEEGQAKLKGNGRTVPPLTAIKTPLRDGDTERPDDPAYAGSYFINANSATAPGIVDADCNPILTRSEVYSGVYGRASINFYAFNSNGNKGIACGLNNLQKIRDGEPLGGKSSAASDFSTDADEDFLPCLRPGIPGGSAWQPAVGKPRCLQHRHRSLPLPHHPRNDHHHRPHHSLPRGEV